MSRIACSDLRGDDLAELVDANVRLGVPPLAVRAYRLGQRRLMHRLITQLLHDGRHDAKKTRATLQTIDGIAADVDDTSKQLIARYFKADDGRSDPQAGPYERVRSVIADCDLPLDEAQKRVGNHYGWVWR